MSQLYWMYRVIPENIDKQEIENIVGRVYGKWIRVERYEDKYSYNIVLSRSSDCKDEIIDYNIVRVCVDKVSEFHARKAIEYGRALLRQWVTWDNHTYLLGVNKGVLLEDYVVHPAFDTYIWRLKHEARILDELGFKHCSGFLIHKRFGGIHYVYSGEKLAAKLMIPDQGFDLYVEQVSSLCRNLLLKEFIEANRQAILRYVMISRKFLDSLGEPDHVLVSFSGGKDSLVVLDLAIKHYGRDMVTGVYVDTGVDFPQTRKYVRYVAEKLDVEIKTVYAPVKELISRYGLPTKSNRWCTLEKTRAFKKVLMKYRERYGKVLVLVGDRDAESLARSKKPPLRKRGKYLEAAPIKQWSTIHVQLYTWLNNLPENPLYRIGFYRLGCYICPALTSLEKHLMLNKLYEILADQPYFKEFIESEKSSL